MNVMRLNLGCGEQMIGAPGWLNVDCRKLTPPPGAAFRMMDMMSIRDYLKDNSLQTVLLRDSLEHVSKPEAEQLLADCVALLAKGGVLEIKTPALHLLLKWASCHDPMNTALRFYGNQDYPENVHKFVWPVETLHEVLKGLGMRIVSSTECEDTNMLLKAVKP